MDEIIDWAAIGAVDPTLLTLNQIKAICVALLPSSDLPPPTHEVNNGPGFVITD